MARKIKNKPYEYRPGKWRAYSSVGGVRQSRTFDSEQAAELWIAERALARQRGVAVEPVARQRGGMRVAEFYTEWAESRDNDVDLEPATRAKYASYWRNHIEPEWGRASLVSVTTRKLDEWVRTMAKDKVGADTITGVVTHFGSMLAAAVVDGKITSNPRKGMKRLPTVGRKPRRAATDEEVAALLDASKGQYRTMWALMAESALRWAEVAGLHVWQLDLTDADRASVYVVSTADRNGVTRQYPKNKRPRRVPLSPATAEALREHTLDHGQDDLVFTSEEGKTLLYHNVADRVWTPTCQAAGVEITMHQLRHHAITAWLDAGVAVQAVADMAGHSDLRMISRYGHTTGTAFDRAREAMTR